MRGNLELHALAAGVWVRRRRVRVRSLAAPGRCRTSPPWSPDPTRARLAGHAAVAPPVPPRWGGEGSAGVRVTFPRLQSCGEQFPTPPRKCKKKKKNLFTFLVCGFVSAILRVGDKKQNFLQKNVAAHTVLQSVSSSGRFRKPPGPAFCTAKEQNNETKDFYFINHLIFAWETLLIEWVCLFCQSPLSLFMGFKLFKVPLTFNLQVWGLFLFCLLSWRKTSCWKCFEKPNMRGWQ